MNTPTETKIPSAGILSGLLAGISFGLITPISPAVYEAGATPMTVTLFRFILGSLVMLVILGITRRSFLVPPKGRLPLFCMSFFIFCVTIFYLSAVQYISIGLAAIVFYTFPVIVTIIDPLLQKRAPSLPQLGLSLLAFTGITIALGPSLDSLDWRGLGFLCLTSLSMCGGLICGRKVVPLVPNLTSLFYVNVVGIVLSCLYLPLNNSFHVPDNLTEFSLTSLIAGLYLVAVLAQITAVGMIGPSRTAMFLNSEPVVTIAMAVLVLHEALGISQIIGALFVMLAIAGTCYRPVTRPKQPAVP
ncbi:DMT family transporter [Kiloniella laminariae]|uniref:DMT family transporter n=1 Tax=Kiloniella laminariae TaxID=454162 RepID=A0ABT4LE94_9PROT|nr:DMT family transporter [Kiloniella laminariae]MCZ4279418.1 DMT family transporter [Kiloniella laminariae]